MVHLRLTGVSEDGRKLVLVSDAGVEFTVDVDDRLRAALDQSPGGDQARLAQLEMQMDSTLRPRDIQARIRAGETPESVAQVAGTSVDKVMPYAAPVLAERAHVAQRAQRASLRRRPADGGGAGARTLGDAVGSHLRARNVDPDTVSWDAWRREDGRWTLTGAYTTGDRVGAAHFSFDAPGNYVVADDDDAHWLLGEVADDGAERRRGRASRPRRPVDARRRRLSAVPPEELPLGEDAIELVSEDPDPSRRPADEAPPRRRGAGRGLPGRAAGRRRRADRRRDGRRRRGRRADAASRRPRRTSRPPASRSRRPAAAPRCRAGTRSCSAAAAPRTERADPVGIRRSPAIPSLRSRCNARKCRSAASSGACDERVRRPAGASRVAPCRTS